MPKHSNGHTSSQRGGGKHGTDNGRGGGWRAKDAGTPQEVGGKRAERRASRTQVVRVGPFGHLSTSRHDRDIPDLASRWRRR